LDLLFFCFVFFSLASLAASKENQLPLNELPSGDLRTLGKAEIIYQGSDSALAITGPIAKTLFFAIGKSLEVTIPLYEGSEVQKRRTGKNIVCFSVMFDSKNYECVMRFSDLDPSTP
jgi:hypothetical protein